MAPVSLVTGAGRGIGRGIAVELAKLGHRIVVNYVSNVEAAEECQGRVVQAGGEAMLVRADVASADDRARLVEQTLDAFGRIDFLVNNSGVAPLVRSDILTASEESFDRLISVNLKGPYFLTQLVARVMIAQDPLPDFPPKIVIVSSISAEMASVNRGDYCLTKAALGMMTKLFAARLAGHGINVYEIRPGVIQTDMTSGVREKYDRMVEEGAWPIRRWGTPEDVGRAVAAIAEGKLGYSTGEVINVDGGIHLRVF